jgi:hypothetical protein
MHGTMVNILSISVGKLETQRPLKKGADGTIIIKRISNKLGARV